MRVDVAEGRRGSERNGRGGGSRGGRGGGSYEGEITFIPYVFIYLGFCLLTSDFGILFFEKIFMSHLLSQLTQLDAPLLCGIEMSQ